MSVRAAATVVIEKDRVGRPITTMRPLGDVRTTDETGGSRAVPADAAAT